MVKPHGQNALRFVEINRDLLTNANLTHLQDELNTLLPPHLDFTLSGGPENERYLDWISKQPSGIVKKFVEIIFRRERSFYNQLVSTDADHDNQTWISNSKDKKTHDENMEYYKDEPNVRQEQATKPQSISASFANLLDRVAVDVDVNKTKRNKFVGGAKFVINPAKRPTPISETTDDNKTKAPRLADNRDKSDISDIDKDTRVDVAWDNKSTAADTTSNTGKSGNPALSFPGIDGTLTSGIKSDSPSAGIARKNTSKDGKFRIKEGSSGNNTETFVTEFGNQHSEDNKGQYSTASETERKHNVCTQTDSENTSVTRQADTRALDVPTPPQEYNLRVVLLELSKEISQNDLTSMKSLLKGPGGLGTGILDSCTTAADFFDRLITAGLLSVNNLSILQAIVWNTGRKDLYKRLAAHAELFGNILYICCPKPFPENGYEYVKFHVKGVTAVPRKEDVERLRSNIAQWLAVPAHFIIIAGFEQTNSWLVTLMVPDVCIQKFPELFNRHRQFFLLLDIDTIKINEVVYDLTETHDKKDQGFVDVEKKVHLNKKEPHDWRLDFSPFHHQEADWKVDKKGTVENVGDENDMMTNLRRYHKELKKAGLQDENVKHNPVKQNLKPRKTTKKDVTKSMVTQNLQPQLTALQRFIGKLSEEEFH